MFSKRPVRRVLALSAVVVSISLAHACSEEPTGVGGDAEAPTNVEVQVIAYNRIRVQWASVAGASGYVIERRADLTGNFAPIDTINAQTGPTTSYTDSDVEAETFYGYRIRTLAAAGAMSAPSEIAGARTPPEPGIIVAVTMTAPDPASADANGFRLRLAGPQTAVESVAAGDSVLLTPVLPGDYTVTLEDIAPTCAAENGASRSVTVSGQGTQTVARASFNVRCRASSRGGVIVSVTTTGDTTDSNGVIARVTGTGPVSSAEDTLSAVPGQTSTSDNITLLDLAPGNYEVLLLDVNATICTITNGASNRPATVTAGQNATVSYNLSCNKNRPPHAEANGPYAGQINSPITFSSAGSSDPDGSIASYAWSFGDGGTAAGAAPPHTYSTAGSYVAKLTVTDNVGATHTDSASVTVAPGFAWKNRFYDDSLQAGEPLLLEVTTKPGVAVRAAEGRISYTTTSLRLDSIVGDSHWSTFSRSGTSPGTASFQATTSSPGDPTQETPVAMLHFTVTGLPGAVVRTTTRNVILQDASGATIPTTNLAIIEDTFRISTGGNRPPIAKANAFPSANGLVGVEMVFTSQPGTVDPDGSIVSYTWSFGDGTIGSGTLARKTYSVPGPFWARLTVTDDGGATASDSVMVTITEPPNVPPTADAGGPYTGVVGSALKFSGVRSTDTDGRVVRYDWLFGDGSGASGPDSVAFRTYSAPGNYVVSLTVIDNRGAASSDTARVTITPPVGTNRPPVAEANGPYTGIVSLPVALHATGTTDPDGNIKRYTWHYQGDPNSTVGFNTLKTFATSGIHKVTLVVEDSLGLIDTDTTSVIVTDGQANLPPIADAGGPYTTRVGLPLAFDGHLTSDPDGLVVSYKWNFGDGTASTDTTQASPAHTYTTAGTFVVTLVVTDNRGASAVDQTAVTVLTAVRPVADAGGPYTGTTGNPITLTAAGSVDVDGTIGLYRWEFNDGTPPVEVTTPTVTHVFTNPGSYTARVIVTDNHGLTDDDVAQVTVTGLPVNAPPIAKANGPYTGTANVPIGFSAAGSQDVDGTITSYAWTFGDGGSGTGQSLTHTYSAAGLYTVVLTVMDDRGGTDADTAQVTVSAGPSNTPPVARASGPATGNAGTSIGFEGSASSDADGTITSYEWDFGDGGTAFAANVTHTFTTGGVFKVKLTVTDNQGATGRDSLEITISGPTGNQRPVAEANGPYSGNVGQAIPFSSANSLDPDGTISTFSWTFGDGGTGSGANPTHAYTAVGTYSVVLTVIDNQGATDADTAQVTVSPAGTNSPPSANAGGPYSGTIGGTAISVTGAASTDPGGAITAYAWDFENDGLFDDATGVSALFTCTAPAGAKTIRLQVTDNGSPALTAVASSTVNCSEGGTSGTTVRGRWVNATGALITTASTGATIFLEIDIQLANGQNIGEWQAVLQWGAGRLTAANSGADLNCSNPGGQATCPSGAPPAGNNDVMAQYIGNSATANQLTFLNGSFAGGGTGIQGLARLQFTAGTAGPLTPTLVVQIANSEGVAGQDLIPTLTVNIPAITIN
jgi:PKD repeat protein